MRVLDDIEPERGSQILHRLKGADRIEEDAESGKSEREHRQSLGGRGRRGGAARVVAEQHGDERLREDQLAGSGRKDDGEDPAQARVAHRLRNPAGSCTRPTCGEIGCDCAHHRDRDHPIGQLEERVRSTCRRRHHRGSCRTERARPKARSGSRRQGRRSNRRA